MSLFPLFWSGISFFSVDKKVNKGLFFPVEKNLYFLCPVINTLPPSGWGIINPPLVKRMGDYRNGLHLSVCPSVCPSVTLSCRSISPEPFERFSLNFGQMFASVSRCAEPISQPCQLKVKVKVMDLILEFSVRSYLLHPWKDFLQTLVICLPQWDDVQNP